MSLKHTSQTVFSLPTVTCFDLLLVHSSEFNYTKSSNLKILTTNNSLLYIFVLLETL